jgi:hypothetical protein
MVPEAAGAKIANAMLPLYIPRELDVCDEKSAYSGGRCVCGGDLCAGVSRKRAEGAARERIQAIPAMQGTGVARFRNGGEPSRGTTSTCGFQRHSKRGIGA